MKKNHVSVCFDRLKRVQKTGKGNVEIKIYLNRKERKFIKIAEISPEEWPDFANSLFVKDEVEKYEGLLYLMTKAGLSLTLKSLNDFLIHHSKSETLLQPNQRQKMFSKYSFIDFFNQELKDERIQYRTRQARLVVLNSLIRYGRIRSFDDLTPANILNYHKWLQTESYRSKVTLKHYHKRLHRYVHKAYEYGYISRDPYKVITIPSGTSAERRPLTEEEIHKLCTIQLRGKEEKARDLFIFSCFTGLSYSDAQAFDFTTMTDKHGELFFIDGSRIKNDSRYYTPILPPAMAVLRMYQYKLPRMSNQKLNDYLHLIEYKISLNKPLTSHLARHTFATMVLSHDVPIESLSRMLGHKDIRTTQLYAKILKTTIHRCSEDLRKLFDDDDLTFLEPVGN